VKPKKAVDRERYTEIYTDDIENALADYDDVTRRPIPGGYECGGCGKFFDTIEARELHWRTVHYRAQEVSVPM
jgi:hypothetical protein